MSQPHEPLAVVGRKRARGWNRVSRGLYRLDACSELAAWQLVLPPSGRFTHLTAAQARGWWVPPAPGQMPVMAKVDRSASRPRRTGLHVVRSDPWRAPMEEAGLRMDSPVDVLLACAADLALLDLVPLLDCALHLQHCTRAELDAAAGCGRRGAPALKRALALADGRSESPWETILRLLHVVCDVAVEPQHEIVTEAGDFVARADLWLVGTRTIHEYDGGDHLRRDQQQADLRRARRLADAGVIRRGYTAFDLVRRPVGVLRGADLTLGRPHEPGRLREWHTLLAESLHTTSGKERLLTRLGRSLG